MTDSNEQETTKKRLGRPEQPLITTNADAWLAMLDAIQKHATISVRAGMAGICHACGLSRYMLRRLPIEALEEIRSKIEVSRIIAERDAAFIVTKFCREGDSSRITYKQVMAAQWLLERGFGWTQKINVMLDPLLSDQYSALDAVPAEVIADVMMDDKPHGGGDLH